MGLSNIKAAIFPGRLKIALFARRFGNWHGSVYERRCAARYLWSEAGHGFWRTGSMLRLHVVRIQAGSSTECDLAATTLSAHH